IDQTSPYYLHTSDQPGNFLVSQPLNGDNYPTWSRAFTMAIQAKNKLGFIDGNLKKPAANSPDFDAWTRCNSMVQSWLVQSTIPTISNSILWIEDTHAVWIDLCDRFWDELSSYHSLPTCTCGAMTTLNTVQSVNQLMDLLQGLNESYSHIRSLLLMEPLPSVNKAYSLILQEERQGSLSDSRTHSIEQAAMVVQRQN
ncbi:LOW QUALITY PROTEIN: UBN2_3 domain-containing protein, partial [Cephalotus follicularis]